MFFNFLVVNGLYIYVLVTCHSLLGILGSVGVRKNRGRRIFSLLSWRLHGVLSFIRHGMMGAGAPHISIVIISGLAQGLAICISMSSSRSIEF
jgi:hypothetical protein